SRGSGRPRGRRCSLVRRGALPATGRPNRDPRGRGARRVTPNAAAGWFDVLLDRDDAQGSGLPEAFRAVYGAYWHLPSGDAPYVCINFVTARGGRVSFSEPGHLGGGDVSGFDARDQWLMGLLRSRADAVMIGDGTMSAEPEQLWTPAWICPPDADAFAAWRAHEGRRG